MRSALAVSMSMINPPLTAPACARARWCADDYRWRADERRSARPSERSQRLAASGAPPPRCGQSGGARCRNDLRARPQPSLGQAVVIDTHPANAPFGKAIGLPRQRVEVGPVELFEERPAGDTEPPDQAVVVELPQQLTDRRIEFGQTVEATVPQAAEQPSLDN